MSDGLIYSIGDLSCSFVMMVCGAYLLTDRHLGRVIRCCHAFIAAGALVNVFGLLADFFDYKGIEYGHVWPGEVIANIGTAVLMATWLFRSLRRRNAAPT
jgi:hypothetical protein